MFPTKISARVVFDRLAWADQMIQAILQLPLSSQDEFLRQPHHVAAAESYLRRALEALLDLGRHILAKGYGMGVTEYKEVAVQLGQQGVLPVEDAALLNRMAGYRNRLVHFYHEVMPGELYEICATRLADLQHLADSFRDWLRAHPEKLDTTL